MTNSRQALVLFRSAIFFTVVFFAVPSYAAKIPLEAWIHDPLITSVVVNPSGTRLAALTLSDVNEAPFVTVWDTKDFTKPPRRFRPDNSKAVGLDWLNDEKLFVIGRQKFDYRYGGKPTLWFRDIAYVVDQKDEKFHELMRHIDDLQSLNLVNRLINEPSKALIKMTTSQLAEEFYELDLNRLTTKRVFRGNDRSSFGTDTLGNVVIRQDIEGSGDNVRLVTSLKNENSGAWEKHFTVYAKDREGVGLEGVTVAADGTVYVVDNTGRDKSVVRTYDPKTKKLSEPVFTHDDSEVLGVVTKTYKEAGEADVIGYIQGGPDIEIIYTDEEYAQLQQRINAALPSDLTNSMVSMTRDKGLIVVHSSGTKEPGVYHLLIDGRQLVPLGREYPNIKAEDLGERRYVTYKARDGLEIPAYLTTPHSGKAPYPAVIMPHGGPWARDAGGWDPWAQFLANRGYVVLQPQYRGSMGWGQKLWRAGDNEWGQKMQDDKDDGARWLVEQGLADEDRLAMYGYSYGGYAAMAAAVRENSPYQCAIAGAGLSELDTFDKITFENPFNREYQNPTIGGLSPLYIAEKANIPILIFHGDRDQRVPVDQSRKFFNELRSKGKDVQYIEIPDLWHSLPWFPQHHLAVYEALEDYLENDCGPDGL